MLLPKLESARDLCDFRGVVVQIGKTLALLPSLINGTRID